MKSLIYFLTCLVGLASCGLRDSVPEQKKKKSNHIKLPNEISDTLELFLSSQHTIRDLAFATDGSRILYTMQSLKFRKSTILERRFENGTWGSPQIVSFAGKYRDLEPFFHPDGSKLFFASDRPEKPNDEPSDFNIWMVKYEDGNYGDPVKLDSAVNQAGNEFYPSVATNGNLYFTAERPGGPGREDIYVSIMSDGKYLPSVALDSVNTNGYEFNAYIAPDESFLICTGYGRSDGQGGGDLYLYNKNSTGLWDTGIHLANGINSEFLDYSPFVDLKNSVLYFSSEREAYPQPGIAIADYQSWVNLLNGPQNGSSNVYAVKWNNPFHIPTDN